MEVGFALSTARSKAGAGAWNEWNTGWCSFATVLPHLLDTRIGTLGFVLTEHREFARAAAHKRICFNQYGLAQTVGLG